MEKKLFLQKLVSGLDAFHLPYDESILERFFQYYVLLGEWNSRMNLVSDRDMERFVEYHILDSLKILQCVDISRVSRILDFGSGAGLPGIPLAILLPHCRFTLVDSLQKRIRFLETVTSSLPLDTITVLRSRVEEIPSSLNGSFDMAVTRATVRLDVFFTLCSRFIRSDGCLVSIKGEEISGEISDLERVLKPHVFHITDCVPSVPESVRSGHIVVISRA